jgi:hypothetical protein
LSGKVTSFPRHRRGAKGNAERCETLAFSAGR